MRKMILIFVIISGFIPVSIVFVQDLILPEWIKGAWHNSYESNLNNHVFWIFKNDSIFEIRGAPKFDKSIRESLNKKYSGYILTTEIKDSVYRIHFNKTKESIIYEFKLQKVDYSDQPVLTYSLTINGVLKRGHSTSCNLVLTK